MSLIAYFYHASRDVVTQFLAVKDGRLFMNVWDKVDTTALLDDGKERYCPPDHVPHSLPVLQSPVCNEPCHIHTRRWRNAHHAPFCHYLKCPSVDDMERARIVYEARNGESD